MQAQTYLERRGWNQDEAVLDILRRQWRERRFDSLAFGIALCAVPVSIAITEILLGIALLHRLWRIVSGDARVHVPRVFWCWSVWAALEIAIWLASPDLRAGSGEIRHLLLIGALFVLLPAAGSAPFRLAIWRGILLTGTIGSAALIVDFARRLIVYRNQIAAAADASFYLRTGGLLHHWMVYAAVEVVVFAALLEFLHTFPEEYRWLLPALLIHTLAILLSLTRMLWLCCLLMLVVHLVRERSRWIWAIPLAPLLLAPLVPAAVRDRVTTVVRPDYYSNAERLQMLRVGGKMVLEHPFRGVGPGRVQALYPRYLSESDALPAYHGHLHNNAIQLAAEFGLPVLGMAIVVVIVLTRDLLTSLQQACDRGSRLLARTALVGFAGFLCLGLTDYTYGHSLGLILCGFAVLSTLPVSGESAH